MKTLARIIITLAAAATFAACAGEPESTQDDTVTMIWELAPDTAAQPLASIDLERSPDYILDSDPTSDVEPGICGCDGAECALATVEENFGCGVCVMVDCGGHSAGGCVFCEDIGSRDATAGSATERAW